MTSNLIRIIVLNAILLNLVTGCGVNPTKRRHIDGFLTMMAERLGSTPGSELARTVSCGMFMCGYSIYFTTPLSPEKFMKELPSHTSGDLIFRGNQSYSGDTMIESLNRILENRLRPERLTMAGDDDCKLNSGVLWFSMADSRDSVEISYCDVIASGRDTRFGGRILTSTIFEIEVVSESIDGLNVVRTPYSTIADDGSVFWHAPERYRYRAGDTVRVDAKLFDGDGVPTNLRFQGVLHVPGKSDLSLDFVNDNDINRATFAMPDAVPPSLFDKARAYTLIITGTTNGRVYTGTLPIYFDQYGGRLLNHYSSAALDSDADGLYNTLVITASVSISHTGSYRLHGVLIDGNGSTVASTSYLDKSFSTQLTKGKHDSPIAFLGQDIRGSGHDGPYRLAHIYLFDETTDWPIIADVAQGVHVTDAFVASSFENPPMTITSGTQRLVRATGRSDTQNDELHVELTLKHLNTGSYRWSASLYTRDIKTGGPKLIASTTNIGKLTPTSPVTLVFTAKDIDKVSPSEGFCVTDLFVEQISGIGSVNNSGKVIEDRGSSGYCFRDVTYP